jgi:hypothetical protein
MANLGPASTQTANTLATLTPVNTTTNSNPQEGGQIRTLASAHSVSLNSTGDIAVMPVVNATRWNVQAVIAANLSTGAGASVAIEVNSSALGAGTTIVAPQILSGLTAGFGGATTAYRFTVQNVTFVGTGQNIYVNCQTTAGTACTFDIFVLGYDLS